jgi:DHA1 family bicyclomycin/chloramphenicol resistance-like MFS transporter
MMHPKRRNISILLLLGSLCVVSPFAIDMYLPAFPQIAADFGVTTPQISLSLSTFFVGFAIGQMIYGPLLDRFGRKPPLYLGLAVYVLCSVGCATSPDLRTFVTLRFLEALGGCVAQVATISMVRDFFPVEESAKVFSQLFLLIGVSPLLAPTIGSTIVAGIGWRWIFGLLATIASAILLTILFLLPEGHEPDPSVSLRPMQMLRAFWTILQNPQFLTYALAGAFSFSGLFGFVAGSPIIFMEGFHMDAKAFGIVFAVLVMGFIGGNELNVLLLRRLTSQKIFLTAIIGQVSIGVLLFVGTRAHFIGIKATLVLFFLFLSCIGLTYPNAAALGLAKFSRDAGRASALLGFLQTGIGALISMAIGVLGVHAMISVLSSTALVALAILYLGKTFIGNTTVESETGEPIVMR